MASDLMNDSSRSFWWLINAPQATASVLQDLALRGDDGSFGNGPLGDFQRTLAKGYGNEELYRTEPVLNKKGKPIQKIKRDKLGIPSTMQTSGRYCV